MARPDEVEKSKDSVKETKTTSRSRSSFSVVIRSASDRPNRSSFQTSIASISRRRAIFKSRPCVLMSQGDISKVLALVLLEVEFGKVKRIDICTEVPHPSSATRTGEYPE